MSDLYDPIDGNLPGSPIPEILQARILEWVTTSFLVAYNTIIIDLGLLTLKREQFYKLL